MGPTIDNCRNYPASETAIARRFVTSRIRQMRAKCGSQMPGDQRGVLIEVARYLRVEVEKSLPGLRIYIVGSSLSSATAGDIDLLFHVPGSTSVRVLEEAMLATKVWGLKHATPLPLDVMASTVSPERTYEQYSPSLTQNLLLLESRGMLRSGIGVPVGSFSRLVSMPEHRRRYFRKLPFVDGGRHIRRPHHVGNRSFYGHETSCY